VHRVLVFLLLVFQFFSSGLFAQNNAIDSLLVLLRNSKADSVRVINLNMLSREYIGIADYPAAYQHSLDALQLSKKLNYSNGISNSYHVIGLIDFNKSDYDKALENYMASLKIRKETGDKAGIASSYNNIGNVYWSQGIYDKAQEAHLLSLEIKKEIGDKKGLGDSYNNIGEIHRIQGNYAKAMEMLLIALKIREEINYKQGIAGSYNGIGNIYKEQGIYSKALENFLNSLNIKKEIGDKKGVAGSYNNMGLVYYNIADYAKSLEMHFAAQKIQEEIGDKSGIASAYLNIGNVYMVTKKTDLALENYFAGLKISEEIGSRRNIAAAYNGIANAYVAKLNYTQAAIWYKKQVDLSIKIRTMPLLLEAYLELSAISEKTNNYQDAFTYYRLYSRLNDSLFNEKSSKQIAEIQARYETEKKDKQINLLEKEKKIQELELSKQQEQTARERVIRNTSIIVFILFIILGWTFYSRYRIKERTKQEQQNAELEMKALRSQMNPHFIFNSLASIQQFIYRQNPDLANDYLSRFSRLIRMIFDHSQKKSIPLSDDIEALKMYIELEQLRLDGKFEYNIQIEPYIEVDDITIPPLIVQPFVENAIWHGISQSDRKGLIEIFVKVNNDEKTSVLEYVIRDNGIGRAQAEKNNTKRDPAHQSQGMNITKERMQILNLMYGIKRSIEIIDLFSDNNVANGTEVRIFIPMKS